MTSKNATISLLLSILCLSHTYTQTGAVTAEEQALFAGIVFEGRVANRYNGDTKGMFIDVKYLAGCGPKMVTVEGFAPRGQSNAPKLPKNGQPVFIFACVSGTGDNATLKINSYVPTAGVADNSQRSAVLAATAQEYRCLGSGEYMFKQCQRRTSGVNELTYRDQQDDRDTETLINSMRGELKKELEAEIKRTSAINQQAYRVQQDSRDTETETLINNMREELKEELKEELEAELGSQPNNISSKLVNTLDRNSEPGVPILELKKTYHQFYANEFPQIMLHNKHPY